MKWFYLTLLLFTAGPVMAAPVVLTTGEHDGFTRLVLDFGGPVDWQVGRSADGYALRLQGASPSYDLRQAFDLISKSRLAAIWVDPGSGALNVGLACACHVIPFEFRPGIVVIDIKEGRPPKGSSFEAALDGHPAAPLNARPALRPRPRPIQQDPSMKVASYDWASVAYADIKSASETGQPVTLQDVPLADPDLQPLRTSLLQQMARGAAQGVVEMAMPRANVIEMPQGGLPLAQVRINSLPGDALKDASEAIVSLTAEGDDCALAETLNLADWGDSERPVSDQWAESFLGMTGEFDRPNPEAVARAIKFSLYLGFGAEALQLIKAFESTEPDASIWGALAYVLDGKQDPQMTFLGQRACEGPSAMWAMLQGPTPIPGEIVNTGAIRLAFLALPVHLRRQIGPQLVDRLLAMDDAGTARALGDSIRRAPGEAGAKVALMDAQLELHSGDVARAEQYVAEVLADPGPDQAEALVTLTETRAAQRLPIEPEVASALQALLADHDQQEAGPRLKKAVVLALAASGDLAGAIAALPASPGTTGEMWGLAASLATDEELLGHAVFDNAAALPRLEKETAEKIAGRLVDLGLAQSAVGWLAHVDQPDPLLRARIALALSDGKAALSALVGLSGEEAIKMTARAYELQGQEEARARVLTEIGQSDAASAAMARAATWLNLARTGSDPWQQAAKMIEKSQSPAQAGSAELGPMAGVQLNGPLAQGHMLANASAETRTAIEALLSALRTADRTTQ